MTKEIISFIEYNTRKQLLEDLEVWIRKKKEELDI